MNFQNVYVVIVGYLRKIDGKVWSIKTGLFFDNTRFLMRPLLDFSRKHSKHLQILQKSFQL